MRCAAWAAESLIARAAGAAAALTAVTVGATAAPTDFAAGATALPTALAAGDTACATWDATDRTSDETRLRSGAAQPTTRFANTKAAAMLHPLAGFADRLSAIESARGLMHRLRSFALSNWKKLV